MPNVHGVGSRNAVGSDGATTHGGTPPTPTGKGSAASPGGTLRPAQRQDRPSPAATTPLQLGPIDETLKGYMAALDKLDKAQQLYIAEKSPASEKAVKKAKEEAGLAESALLLRVHEILQRRSNGRTLVEADHVVELRVEVRRSVRTVECGE